MADDGADEDLARLVADLVRTLRDLEQELGPPEPGETPRLPTPRDLRRLTSEVAIPGLILVLETNIRALRLLQRALRLADGADRASEETARIQERARSASETTLEKLDDALVELRDAVEGRPNDENAAQLLEEARDLRDEVQRRLRESRREAGARDASASGGEDADGSEEGDDGPEPVAVDVDAELKSIKDELDGAEDRPGTGDPGEGRDGPGSSGPGDEAGDGDDTDGPEDDDTGDSGQ